jgi:hypothetical protein
MNFAGDIETAGIDSERLQGVTRKIAAAPPFGPMFILAFSGNIRSSGAARVISKK